MESKKKVADAELYSPIIDVRISFYDSSNKLINETTTRENGSWDFDITVPWQRVVFSHDDFVEKTYSPKDKLPEIVRLIKKELYGYQNKLWFLPGENINLHVHTPYEYNATLYRHGINKEKILDLGDHPKKLQADGLCHTML